MSRRKMSGVHSPAGGVLVRGIHYKPGQFIPSAEIEKASHEQWSNVQEQRAKLMKYQRSDGSLDTEKMLADRPKVKGGCKKVKKSRPHSGSLQEAPKAPEGFGPVAGYNAPSLTPKAPSTRQPHPVPGRLHQLIQDANQVGGRMSSQRQETPDYSFLGWAARQNGAPEALVDQALSGDYHALLELLDWVDIEGHGRVPYMAEQASQEIRQDLKNYEPWLHGEGEEMPAIDVRPRRVARHW